MILAFAHPGLVVPDLEKAKDFYAKMFGFKVISNEGWENNPDVDRAVGLDHSVARGHLMAGHNCHLELWEYSAPAKAGPAPSTLRAQELGIRHLAFYVDDCRKEYQRFLKLGGDVLGQPVGSDEGGYVVYCRDPFGNIIELCEIPSDQEDPTRLPGVSRLGDFPNAND
jgi:catechol 2,3-dioxygenase-like lactoylglutathione lyase family enzyme